MGWVGVGVFLLEGFLLLFSILGFSGLELVVHLGIFFSLGWNKGFVQPVWWILGMSELCQIACLGDLFGLAIWGFSEGFLRWVSLGWTWWQCGPCH